MLTAYCRKPVFVLVIKPSSKESWGRAGGTNLDDNSNYVGKGLGKPGLLQQTPLMVLLGWVRRCRHQPGKAPDGPSDSVTVRWGNPGAQRLPARLHPLPSPGTAGQKLFPPDRRSLGMKQQDGLGLRPSRQVSATGPADTARALLGSVRD